MADLSSLMSVAPGTAAFMMGQNQQQGLQSEALKQRELQELIQQRQAEAQQKALMAPLLQRHQELANSGLQEGLAGITAKSKREALAAEEEASTSTGRVAATNSDNGEKVAKHTFEQATRARDFMLQAGPQLAGIPGPARVGAFRAMLTNAGINPDAAHIQQLMALGMKDPDAMLKQMNSTAQALGDQLLQMNPAARASIEHAKIAAAASNYHADKAASATVRAAEIAAESRKAVAAAKGKAQDLVEGVMSGKVAPDKAAVAAKMHAERATDPDEKEFWQARADEFETFATSLRAASNNGKPTITPQGAIGERQTPKALSAKPPAMGQTKSGTKFKIVTD